MKMKMNDYFDLMPVWPERRYLASESRVTPNLSFALPIQFKISGTVNLTDCNELYTSPARNSIRAWSSLLL